ncbi:hypothetical protein SPRG_11252 [Saprolegnia parasitica CBS 223.65]|uniref:MATE efflux family protein n=1 Tax=Saprolegnia parasitica (strain CBS 223.65) TaxID=695850 RepID=A0A067C3V4_SAPPC|nr:hypothetical protein SPRG_11252 [Saprolegnia parasitica CBS 223.65]KDO23820.1 hypothetical protein SPRG_11252 [Saprolegnia parasitica CBS 223.65]|eukprot:XP_012205453.1 hypothetical protein SPRG_11252 [Saprolegnia parasitica CBS 223.65]
MDQAPPKTPRPLWRDEATHLLRLALPIMATFILGYLPGVVSLIFVGQIHRPDAKEYLAAASLSDMFFNVTGFSIGLGLASAMDTLASQAFGAGNIKRIGILLQTGSLVLFGVCVPIAVLNLSSTHVLLALDQPTHVAALAGPYSACLVMGLPFLYAYELLKRALQAQNIAWPMLYSTLLANAVNAGVGYLLVYHTSMGYLGAAIGRATAMMSLPLSLLPYFYLTPGACDFWPGLHARAALRGVGEFLAVGTPGMLMMMFEWCSFEILALFAGVLPNAVIAIGANAVTVNVFSIVDWIYYGLNVSATVRVGNAIGGGDVPRARAATTAVLSTAAGLALCFASLLLATRWAIPDLFTNDRDVSTLVASVVVVLVLFQVPQGINQTMQGVLRGYGLQNYGAIINFVAYIGIGLPVAYLLAFIYAYGLQGLWMGMGIGFAFAGASSLLLLRFANIESVIEKKQVQTLEERSRYVIVS